MLNALEQAAKAEHVPVFFNDELVILDRWTMTQLEAMAYRENMTVEALINRQVKAVCDDPARLNRIVERAQVGA
ncbi:MAG: hypothetical protein WC091_07345 [Sulfuricellaceae bacterium]